MADAGAIVISGPNDKVYNTLIYNNGSGVYSLYNGGSNTELYNNTLYNNGSVCIYSVNASPGIYKNNICDTGSITSDGAVTARRQSQQIVRHLYRFSWNPLFVSPTTGNFHLRSGSMARGAGVDLSSEGVITRL